MNSLNLSSTWKRHTWTGRPLHISGFINRYKEQISTTSMAVRVLNLWPIINQTDNFLGTAFLCFNLEGETLEGRLSQQLSTAYPKLLSAGGIYELSNYIIVPNNRKYKLTPQPYLIHINHEASVKQVEHKIPVFPAQRFSPLNFRQLIGNIKADVVGQIRIMQGINRDYPESKAKLVIGLLLNRYTMVKLTLWGNEASYFRQLQSMTNQKYRVVLVASIIPRICKGKLLLTSSFFTRFCFEETINHISGFRGRVRISGRARERANRHVTEKAQFNI